MRILILCTNYNTYEKAERYIDSVIKSAGKAGAIVDILVGDNSDPVKDISIKNTNCALEVIKTYSNLGYFGGITYAIKHSKISLKEYDYIILSNVDLIVSEDFFTVLSDNKYRKNVGCIAPSIYSLDTHNDRNPKMTARPSKRRLIVLRFMYQFPILFTTYVKYFRRKRVSDISLTPRVIYAPHGSFMVFTSAAADFLQNMTFGAFMFCEEIFIGENMNRLQLQVLYDPTLKVIDSDHESTKRVKKNTIYKWNVDALSFILNEYY